MQDNSTRKNTEDTIEDEVSLSDAVEASDKSQVVDIVESISSHEALRQVSLMDFDERDQLLVMLGPETAAELIEEAPDELAVTMIEHLEVTEAAKIMEELHSDTQADIVQEMESESSEALLSAMDSVSAEGVRKLSQYEADTAGGLMELEAFSFPVDGTVGSVLKSLVEGHEAFERHRGQHPYILDADGKLVGVVSLRDMLRSKRSVLLADIMHEPLSVHVDTPQEELAELFDDNPFLGIPVVDG